MMNFDKDYYKILEVPTSADIETIKKSFRSLALKYHPDKNNGDDAKFKEINEAYQILSDPNKKSQYDNRGNIFGSGFENNFTNFDINDFFNAHFTGGFGNSRGSSAPQRGQDIEVVLPISIYEAIVGVNKPIEFSILDNCVKCSGTGASERSTCSTCKGSGVVVHQSSANNNRQVFLNQTRCTTCGGRGFIIKTKCSECHDGKITVSKKIDFQVNPGTQHGSVARAGINGGPSGDMYVQISVIIPNKNQLSEEQLNILKTIKNE